MILDILEKIYCIRCFGELEVECIKGEEDCIEGFLRCDCGAVYPIIDGVAIIIDDIAYYFANRSRIVGELFVNASKEMKEYIKRNIKGVKAGRMDRYERYGSIYNIYQESVGYDIKRFLSINEEFYDKVAEIVNRLCSEYYLDVGCGLGYVINRISAKLAVGVDRSFSMIRRARDGRRDGREFIVADLFSLPTRGFNIISLINVIDLFDVDNIIQSVRKGMKYNDYLILVDPYDFRDEHGDPLYSYNGGRVRSILRSYGFTIENEKEEYIPWILKINDRAYMLYFSDLIIAKLV